MERSDLLLVVLFCEQDSSLRKKVSHVILFATLWMVVYQAPPSMGFSRQEYCVSGLIPYKFFSFFKFFIASSLPYSKF